MRYSKIEGMCMPRGNVRGCPFDGLGCIGREDCSINSSDPKVSSKAYNANNYEDFVCVKERSRRSKR